MSAQSRRTPHAFDCFLSFLFLFAFVCVCACVLVSCVRPPPRDCICSPHRSCPLPPPGSADPIPSSTPLACIATHPPPPPSSYFTFQSASSPGRGPPPPSPRPLCVCVAYSPTSVRLTNLSRHPRLPTLYLVRGSSFCVCLFSRPGRATRLPRGTSVPPRTLVVQFASAPFRLCW